MWIDGLTLECFSTIAKLQICANYSKLYAFACAYGCVNACVCVCMCVRTRFKCLLKHTCILIGLPLIGPKLEALVNCADILSNIFVGPTWSVHVSWPYIDLGLVWHVYRPVCMEQDSGGKGPHPIRSEKASSVEVVYIYGRHRNTYTLTVTIRPDESIKCARTHIRLLTSSDIRLCQRYLRKDRKFVILSHGRQSWGGVRVATPRFWDGVVGLHEVSYGSNVQEYEMKTFPKVVTFQK